MKIFVIFAVIMFFMACSENDINKVNEDVPINELCYSFKNKEKDIYKAWAVLKSIRLSNGIYGVMKRNNELVINYMTTTSKYPKQMKYEDMFNMVKEKNELNDLKQIITRLGADRINIEAAGLNVVINGGGVLGADKGYICGLEEKGKQAFKVLRKLPENKDCYAYID